MKLLLALAVSCLVATDSAAFAQDIDPPGTGRTAPQASEPGPEPSTRNGDYNPSGGEAKAEPGAAAPNSTSQSICLLVESAAQAHGLPFEFFARLIWQESRFKPDAVGPLTRGGRRALGISQFMPGTASERGLLDPFDPVAALPKAAEFLKELHAQFGNLGLAAAAYNAGPQRVRDWLDGRGALPRETRNYVLTITGRSADEWAATRRGDGDKAPIERTSCGELMALLKAQPSPFIGELERRVLESGARPWGVQLSAGFLRERVLAVYAAIEKTYRTVLENRDPIIIENKFRSRGTQSFYQVRVGADTRAGANELCAALRSAGGACLVLRNLRGAVQPL
jgi:transglycosylase-like protein with SLT domain/sporulation related protein